MEEGALKTASWKRQNLSVSFLDRRLCRGKQHEEKPGDRREQKKRSDSGPGAEGHVTSTFKES